MKISVIIRYLEICFDSFHFFSARISPLHPFLEKLYKNLFLFWVEYVTNTPLPGNVYCLLQMYVCVCVCVCVRARARALLPERVGRPLLLTFDNGRTTIILKGLFFPAESALWPYQHTRLYERTRTMDVGSWRGNRRRVAGHHRTSGLNLSLALFFFFNLTL